jgi:hypothetical protein
VFVFDHNINISELAVFIVITWIYGFRVIAVLSRDTRGLQVTLNTAL